MSIKCVSCLTPIPEASASCPFCGTPVVDPAAATIDPQQPRSAKDEQTAGARAAASPAPARSSRLISSSSSIDDSRFVPGAMLLERYRIVGLLGQGGMGEVYRAEDLKLGQVVALKFLPVAISQDTAALARFHREVRIARQVSHPNVCRVFDIGEVDGQVFLSMEYIDGEDLGSLLRRIGHLPADKALEIARQLCAGLAAAHEMGVLHRDLKPANVMIDGRGKARITDFGLAVLGDDLHAGEARAGTPGYMAPEQATGKGASTRSDIYSLGLVLYELFTGKRVFEASSIVELLRRQDESAITHPSALVKDIDPVVERVILRCLEKEPRSRPASALQVALALPGGDPLAAALAAGETPSPEMVAAAGEKEGFRPAYAWACVAALIASMAFTLWPGAPIHLLRHAPMDKSPDALRERAQNILQAVGQTNKPGDSSQGFETGYDYLRYVEQRVRWAHQYDHEVGPVQFFYRSSPQALYNFDLFHGLEEDAPHLHSPGEAMVRLTPKGRLIKLIVVPPQVDRAPTPAAPVDWGRLFAEAGLDTSQWTAVTPEWTPPTYADARAAWTGSIAEFPGVAMRIEAASYAGKPVYFELIGPWTPIDRVATEQLSTGERVTQFAFIALLVVVLAGGALLARRNLRLGRGDRRGATRLGGAIFVVVVAASLLGNYHVNDTAEVGLLMERLSWALFLAAITWMLYIALEPLVRRRWPTALVSWSRLLAGEFRDPLVQRDVLLGLAGTLALNVGNLCWLVAYWLGTPPTRILYTVNGGFLFDGRRILWPLAGQITADIQAGLAILFVLFLFRLLMRRDWLAGVIFVVLFTIIFSAPAGFAPASVAAGIVVMAVVAFATLRCGLLTMIVLITADDLLHYLPLTPDPSAWYFGLGVVGMAAILALAGFAFYTSLGGRPAFGGLKLEDG